MQSALRRTFASLGVYNYRLYFIGQGISQCGSWMQLVGLSILVLHLTHSGTQLGLITATQFLPILLLGMLGGIVTDSFSKRKLLYITQSIQAALALLLGILVLTHHVEIWMVYSIASLVGLSMVVDNPTRQTFIVEMVGGDRLKNAVTLNSILVNSARIIGPTIAASLIATVGLGVCFIVNAATYIAILLALLLMRTHELQPGKRASLRETGQIRAGLRYVLRTPTLRSTLLMMVIIGTFVYEFNVSLPLLATRTFHGDATSYSFMTIAMGAGAVLGGLYTAGKGLASQRWLYGCAVLFGISLLLVAIAPNLMISLLLLVIMGGLSVVFISLGNSTLQLTSAPEMRGRVMALWAIAFAGTTPVGGPVIGFVADHASPRISLVTGGTAAIAAAAAGMLAYTGRKSAKS